MSVESVPSQEWQGGLMVTDCDESHLVIMKQTQHKQGASLTIRSLKGRKRTVVGGTWLWRLFDNLVEKSTF